MGLSLIAEGVAYVQSPNRSLAVLGSASLAFISGGLLLAGLMTSLVSVMVAIEGIGIALSWLPSPAQDLFNSNLAIINLIVLAITIGLLGPGAFSLDALMFGRREITIPSSGNLTRP